MATIDLTKDEITVLDDLLENYLTELHSEIYHTDDRDFKAALKRRQALFEGISGRLASIPEQSM